MQLERVTTFILDKLRRELPVSFSYHNVDHTLDVMRAVKEIGSQEHVTGDELQLLLTAALFHDTGFLISAENHELHSCHMASKYLPSYFYSEQDISQINDLIMATKMPQQPKNHLEEILCDADLDYLGRADFFEISEKLYDEMLALGTISSHQAYMQLQLNFLSNHRYFSNAAKVSRNKLKEENLTKIKTNSEA